MFRATPTDPAEWFAPDELDRSRRYQRPLRRLRLVRSGLGFGLIVLFIVGRLGTRLPDALGADGWIARLVVVVVALQVIALLYDVPLDWWVDMVHDKRWQLSTQTVKGFIADQVKSLVITTVLGVAVAVVVFALIRSTDAWWLWGWLVVSALSIVFGFLYPIVLAPLFNTFTPLEPGELSTRVDAVANQAGVRIKGTYVVDESRRSRRDNAYVAGLGATRRVVLYDTLLEHPVDVVEQVVAHEIGHWRLRHLRRQLPLAVAVAFVAFAFVRVLSGWDWLLDRVGLDEGFGDPAALPLLLLGAQVGFGITSLVTAFVSRAFERQADLQALELLRRPDQLIDMHRRIHVKNLADLDPGRLKRLLLSHPPAAERMAMARAWSGEPTHTSLPVHRSFT
jgi:STE24 endopeptidase